MLIVYFIGLVGIVLFTRKARSMEDFAVGSRQIPGGIIFATLSATFIGPGYSMGLANKAGYNGYIWLLIFLAFSLQTLLVGYFVAPRLRQFQNAYTLGDVMGYRYGKLVKIISGILSVALSAGFVGVIAKAAGDIISSITGLPFLWAVILSTVIVIIYSTFGGIKTVIITDVLQFIILAISVPLILIFMGFDVGFSELISKIPNNINSLSGHFPAIVLFGLFLSFLLGETLIPPYANRALMAKDHKQAKKGFLMTGFFSIAWFFVCATIGILGSVLFPDADNIYLTAMNTFLPVGLLGLAIAALMSIVMSSQDSILNAASVSFNNDILAVFSDKYKDDQKALRTSRLLNLLIGIVATIFAINVPGIVEALLYCYTLWAPTIVLPLIIATLKKDAKPIAGLAAIITGGLVTGIWEWGLGNPYQIPSLLVGVLANQVAFWLVQSFSDGSIKHNLFIPIQEKSRG